MDMIYNVKKHLKTKQSREDDSIPLADGDPADFVEDSLVSEDKRKVGGSFVSNQQTMMMDETMMMKVWRHGCSLHDLMSVPRLCSMSVPRLCSELHRVALIM